MCVFLAEGAGPFSYQHSKQVSTMVHACVDLLTMNVAACVCSLRLPALRSSGHVWCQTCSGCCNGIVVAQSSDGWSLVGHSNSEACSNDQLSGFCDQQHVIDMMPSQYACSDHVLLFAVIMLQHIIDMTSSSIDMTPSLYACSTRCLQ